MIEGVTRPRDVRSRCQAATIVPSVLHLMLAAGRAPGAPVSAHATIVACDRALCCCLPAALRCSELIALARGDFATVPGRGLRLLVRRSKSDHQEQGSVRSPSGPTRRRPVAGRWRALNACLYTDAPTRTSPRTQPPSAG